MSEAFAFEGGATESVVRTHAAELTELGVKYGVTEIRFASTGRLLARIDHERDPFDPFLFAAEAERLLGAPVLVLSDTALGRPNASGDLADATPL